MIHFDIKPANILISPTGSLKIGDFGLATRWPRAHPSEILKVSGLGGVVPTDSKMDKLEREGDRVYMPPEMLQGVFVMAADIFRRVVGSLLGDLVCEVDNVDVIEQFWSGDSRSLDQYLCTRWRCTMASTTDE